MLELSKILRDIDNLGRERAESITCLKAELAAAVGVIDGIREDLDTARSRITNAKTSWLTAGFEKSPDKTYSLPKIPLIHSIAASDGSQIVPDKQEIVLCYLLNAASIVLHYGTGARPQARSVPKLYYRDEDLFKKINGKKVRIGDKQVGMNRTRLESDELGYAIQQIDEETPAVAMWDGSLIRWEWDSEPTDYKKSILAEYLSVFYAARQRRIPIAGYISDPKSSDFVNSMRIMLCDQDSVNCDMCKYGDDERKPCDALGRLIDASIYSERLSDGSRSILFRSSSKILREYGDHYIWAFYLNVGREIVRIEVPEWVAMDEELLNRTHALCYDQASKGRGYPVALSEAHEHAVVRSADSSAFYSAVERSFIKHGAKITRSLKRISKNY